MPLSHESCSNLRLSLSEIEAKHAKLVALLIKINDTGSSKLFNEAVELKRQIESSLEAIEMEELFGELFITPEDIVKAFTLPDGRKGIEISVGEQAQARIELGQKLKEPNIVKLLNHFNKHPDERKDWTLIYCPKDGVLQATAGNIRAGMNIAALKELVGGDLHISTCEKNPELSLPNRWMFVRTSCLPNSKGNINDQPYQTRVVNNEAIRLGNLSPKTPPDSYRPSPNLLAFVQQAVFKKSQRKTRLFENEYSRTEVWSAEGWMCVGGDFDFFGFAASINTRGGHARSDVGVSLAL